MKRRILYSKKYPKIDYDEIEKELANMPVPKDLKKKGEELYSKLKNDSTYVLIPERVRLKDFFIKKAIEFSELYEMDIEVIENMGSVEVLLSFDTAGFMVSLKKIILLADDIIFFAGVKDRDITMSLTFNTHKRILK